MDSYQPGIGFEYSKHAEYWGGEPFMDRWTVPIIPEYSNRYAQFLAGRIITFTPTAGDVLNIVNDAPDTVILADKILPTHMDSHFFGLHELESGAPWADPRVRIAIRQSIDFKSISEVESARPQLSSAGIDIDVLTTTHVPPTPGMWLDPEKGELGEYSKYYLYDPADAKAKLEAAGFTAPIPLPFHIAEATDMNILTIDSLRNSGNFEPETVTYLNSVEFRDCGRANNCYGMQQQLSHDGEVDRLLYRQYHTLGNIARSAQPLADEAFDQKIIAQRVELDPEKRRVILKDLQLELAQRMTAIPGRHHFNIIRFSWPWVHNLAWGLRDGTGRDYIGAHKHWLDADMPSRDTL
jgi:ABC-type transport system substrate-binding protein